MPKEIYDLRIDGPLFRQQREQLFSLHSNLAKLQQPDSTLLEALAGLINLTDEIADQAHDLHGIDCLIIGGE